MATKSGLDPRSQSFDAKFRPPFFLGQHDSTRRNTLTEAQVTQLSSAGFSFCTSPVTNQHFYERVIDLYRMHLLELIEMRVPGKAITAPSTQGGTHKETMTVIDASLPPPIVTSLTDEDTSLAPGRDVQQMTAYASPWVDLCSPDHIIAGISRQVLNLEVSYASFCGVSSIIVPGPRTDCPKQVLQFARAIKEAMHVAKGLQIMIHMPMYREPGLEEPDSNLTQITHSPSTETQTAESNAENEIDLFGAWDSWHTIRTICNYDPRLTVALRIPRRLPEKQLQTRWFSEPLQKLTFGPTAFQYNKTGHPALGPFHQQMIATYMRLKRLPCILLCDVGPSPKDIDQAIQRANADYPSLSEAEESAGCRDLTRTAHVKYMYWLESQQQPVSQLENNVLNGFQDWLQSPLQPLSDNLESATYEVFEGDPVKYNLYEEAIAAAMADWKALKKPMSAKNSLIMVVAGAGRGPLVSRALHAARRTDTPIQLWALEKNQNALVYLMRRNRTEWDGQVHVTKTDMRGWDGPVVTDEDGNESESKVDILISELLGSFGDNELSPECLDGIQHHVARPHGISIPASYTAHLSPIASPRIHSDLKDRAAMAGTDPSPFGIPWVTHLYQLDFVAQHVPGSPRFQQAWEFKHPNDQYRFKNWASKYGTDSVRTGPKSDVAAAESVLRARHKTVDGGGASMQYSEGRNEHNSRSCHLTFVTRDRGVIHGLAGYFESVLYTPQTGEEREPIELSILPDQIDKKSKDMVSWFPIFFPLKEPLYFPTDSELEVSMWRQTDDSKVWYEWTVEAYAQVGPTQRLKVQSSKFHSSKDVACLM